MPAGRGDRRTGDEQARAGRDAVAERIPHRNRHVVAAAGVAGGRGAAHEQPAHVRGRPDDHALDRLGSRDVPVVVRRGEVHVDVRLDEPGQERDVAEVVDLVRHRGVRRQVRSRDDRDDPIVLGEHGVVGQPAGGRAVRHAGRQEQTPRHRALLPGL